MHGISFIDTQNVEFMVILVKFNVLA